MNELGQTMASEIAEIPGIFASLLKNDSLFDPVRDILIEKNIHTVLILARGTSDNAAHFLKYLIETQLGLPCGLTSPSSVTIYNSTLHFKGTLVVAISQSGRSPDLVRFATAASQAGAEVISITNDVDSPLAELADHHLALNAGPELAVAATKSYAAQLMMCYLLVASWTRKKIASEALLVQARKLVERADLVTLAVEQCERGNEIVVLGRGFAYPNARETALKVQETNKISVQGLSTADYLHGPISALTPNTQVFILSPSHMPEGSINEALIKLRENGARVFWIGNGGTPRGNDVVIAGSDCDDEITSSIVDSISLQRFALEFAVKSGLDPDSPVGLSKVTLTH
jgi:glucosamine--fructose-6-phosphate aminotransferase (isomerizing)